MSLNLVTFIEHEHDLLLIKINENAVSHDCVEIYHFLTFITLIIFLKNGANCVLIYFLFVSS